jgi:hypothetical protein
MILFLDFDGVLHPDPCHDAAQLFEHAPRLAGVLDDFPEVSVVLSTSWRTERTIDDLVAALPEPMRPRVLGVTPLSSAFRVPPRLMPYRRQAECERWLEDNDAGARDWLALDDRASWFEPYFDALIECDSLRGFDEFAERRLRSALIRGRRKLLMDVDANS